MNIYDKLEQLSLTESEKTLIDYVVEHSEDIMNMSASDISKNSYVSVSTIYRIIDKLGFSGLHLIFTLIVKDTRKNLFQWTITILSGSITQTMKS